MQLFHRTSVSQARAIIRDGFRNEKWRFGSDDVTGEALKVLGVWLTDRPPTDDEGPPGAALLEVTLALDEAALASFEIRGVLAGSQLWIVPAGLVNQHASIRLTEVDARSSWFHDRIEEPEE